MAYPGGICIQVVCIQGGWADTMGYSQSGQCDNKISHSHGSSKEKGLWLLALTPGKSICLTSLTRAKCGIPSTLCWKIDNISGSIELFAL